MPAADACGGPRPLLCARPTARPGACLACSPGLAPARPSAAPAAAFGLACGFHACFQLLRCMMAALPAAQLLPLRACEARAPDTHLRIAIAICSARSVRAFDSQALQRHLRDIGQRSGILRLVERAVQLSARRRRWPQPAMALPRTCCSARLPSPEALHDRYRLIFSSFTIVTSRRHLRCRGHLAPPPGSAALAHNNPIPVYGSGLRCSEPFFQRTFPSFRRRSCCRRLLSGRQRSSYTTPLSAQTRWPPESPTT